MTLTIGQQLKNDGWKITYIRNARNLSKGEAVFTILSRPLPKSESGLEDQYEYRYSICNPKDNFSRRLGLSIAHSKPSKIIDIIAVETVIPQIASEISNEKLSPDAHFTLVIYALKGLSRIYNSIKAPL